MFHEKTLIGEIISEINEVTDSSDILGNTNVTPDKISFGNEPFRESDPRSDGLVQGNTFGDGAFLEEQRFPYEPKCGFIEQIHEGSCLAACEKMILRDNGIEVSEAYVRAVTGVDAIDGGYLRDVPNALNKLGLDKPYTYETDLSIDELDTATEDGAAIISVNFRGGLHALVIDGVEDDMVLIRDPARSTYKVTIQDFKQQWYGIAVIRAP